MKTGYFAILVFRNSYLTIQNHLYGVRKINIIYLTVFRQSILINSVCNKKDYCTYIKYRTTNNIDSSSITAKELSILKLVRQKVENLILDLDLHKKYYKSL